MSAATLNDIERTTARNLYDATVDMRSGRVSAEEYRAAMRASREQHGDRRHEAIKLAAFSMDDKVNA